MAMTEARQQMHRLKKQAQARALTKNGEQRRSTPKTEYLEMPCSACDPEEFEQMVEQTTRQRHLDRIRKQKFSVKGLVKS